MRYFDPIAGEIVEIDDSLDDARDFFGFDAAGRRPNDGPAERSAQPFTRRDTADFVASVAVALFALASLGAVVLGIGWLAARAVGWLVALVWGVVAW